MSKVLDTHIPQPCLSQAAVKYPGAEIFLIEESASRRTKYPYRHLRPPPAYGLGFALGLQMLERLRELSGHIDTACLTVLGPRNMATHHIATNGDATPVEINIAPLQG